MRSQPLLVMLALATSSALSAPILVEDTREISVFALAYDSQGEGPPVGPVIISRSAPGAFFAEQRAVSANAPGFGASAVAGAIQFSQFHDAPGLHFSADGAAEVQVDLLDPLGGADTIAQTTVRLVFRLTQDTPFELSGELTMFSLGDVSSQSAVSLSAAEGSTPVFERALPGAFDAAGVLEQGVWVLELHALARSEALLPDPFESSNAVGSFRDIEFVLAPAPGSIVALAMLGWLAPARRR